MDGKRFLTVFHDLEPVHLRKDVGALPYHLATACGWRSSLAFFERKSGAAGKIAETGYAKAVRLLPLGKRRGRFRNAVRIAWFLATHGNEFDVVNFYHDGVVTLLYVLLFKFVRPGGVVYLKLDMDHLELQQILEGDTRTVPRALRRIKLFLSKRSVDLYTAETAYACRLLADIDYFRGRLHFLPNGFARDGGDDPKDLLSGKENILLTVGRIGSRQKHNELLVDAASALDPEVLRGWKVYFVGPVEGESFRSYVDQAIRKNPHLGETFVFPGRIDDTEELFGIYRKARIFCLTSRWESFGIVLLEAMYFGNYVISTDLPASRELTRDGTIGSLFPVGDAAGLAGRISDAIAGRIDTAKGGMESHRFVRDYRDWRIIVRKLDRLLGDAADRIRG